MITTWEEINSRYDAIKDHKPRAAKKLKELGEILSSAYKLDPQRADEMWQYIIELNIKDNIVFSKFYIAQVFNKITKELPYKEAAEFVSMRPERVRLMLIYGYDGWTLNHVAYTIIGGQLIDGRIDEAAETVSILKEKFTKQATMSIYSLRLFLNTLCSRLENKQEQAEYSYRYDIPSENILAFYEACYIEFDDEFIAALLQVRSCLLKEEPIQGIDNVKRITYIISVDTPYKSYEIRHLYLDFLYLERDIIGDEAENIIYEYCYESNDFRLPVISNENNENDTTKSKWYQDIVSKSYRILRELFSRQPCRDFLKKTLYNCMYESDWRMFLQLLVLGLNQKTEHNSTSYLEFVKEEIWNYLSIKGKKIENEGDKWWAVDEPEDTENVTSNDATTITISFTMRYLMAKPRVTIDNVDVFIQTLARACVLTSNSEVNEQLIAEVRSFVSKETGSVDALTALGLDVTTDSRTELEKFRDFAEMESAKRMPYDTFQGQQQENKYIRNIEKETGTYGIETGKLLATHPQILSFLFLHDAHAFSIKSDIILGALLDGHFSTALKCVDCMMETAKYPNFSCRNSWSMEMKNTLKTMLLDIYNKQTASYGEPYPDNITSTAIQIAENCLPYLAGDEEREVKAELLKLRPNDDGRAELISQLMEDVDAYTAEKKPKGYAERINSITSAISTGIEILAKQDRLDVIAQILRKITDRRQFITGSSYIKWMTDFEKLGKTQAIDLYHMIPDVYSKFIEASDTNMALELLIAFGRLGNPTIYNELKNQVIQKHGYIDGIASCYCHTEETAKPLSLVNNRYIKVSFLYWNASATVIAKQLSVSNVKIGLRTNNKCKDYISLYATDIAINGIALPELKKQRDRQQSDRECISSYIRSGEEETNEMWLYWGFSRNSRITEITEITFSLIAQSYDKVISNAGPFTIRYNSQNDSYEILKTR